MNPDNSGQVHQASRLRVVLGGLVGWVRRITGRLSRSVRRWWAGCRLAYAHGGISVLLAHMRERIRLGWLRLRRQGQSEDELARIAMRYWTEGDKAGVDLADYSHWQGAGPWRDREQWLALGAPHHRLFIELCQLTGTARPLRSAIEWGCGGGANAIHFVRDVQRYCGLDITPASLGECGRVLSEAGFAGFEPVLIQADRPEDALTLAPGPFDLFLCTYVFELLPGRQYGERVTRIAYELLRPGGLGLIQIRYDDGTDDSAQQTLDYYQHATRFTSYRVEAFWHLLQTAGFEPRSVYLVPERTANYSGDRYAYFSFVRPIGDRQLNRR